MGYRMICTVAILGFVTCPTTQRLTWATTAMLHSATTGDIGRAVEGTALNGISGLLPASLDHELDYFHVVGGSEDIR